MVTIYGRDAVVKARRFRASSSPGPTGIQRVALLIHPPRGAGSLRLALRPGRTFDVLPVLLDGQQVLLVTTSPGGLAHSVMGSAAIGPWAAGVTLIWNTVSTCG